MMTGPYGDDALPGPTGHRPRDDGAPGDGAARYQAPTVSAGYQQPGFQQPGIQPPGYPAAPFGYSTYAAPRNGLGTAALVLSTVTSGVSAIAS
jgi:hypothetical protein